MTSTKKIQSHEPDVTVIVGSGDDKREFLCYSAQLAHASPVLDAMLNSGMMEGETKRICFPDKDPEEWAIILECIDPARGFLFDRINDCSWYEAEDDEIINYWNARYFVYWFHELQMDAYLSRCDKIMSASASSVCHITPPDSISVEQKMELLEILSFATMYNLPQMLRDAISRINTLLERFLWGIGDPTHFDLATVEQLIEVFRSVKTFEDKTPQCRKKKLCDCSLRSDCEEQLGRLWDQMSSCISHVMSGLSIDEINTGKHFPHLVHSELQRDYEKMNTALKSISKRVIGGKKGLSLKTTDDSDLWYEEKEFIGTVGVKITMNQILDMLFKRVRCTFVTPGKIGRRYNLSKDKKTLHMEWDIQPAKPESATRMANQKGTEQRLRSGNWDLIVVIGTGPDEKQFECDSTILALASSKLDAMVSNAISGKLCIPNMKPNGWESFYECIDPRNNCMNLSGGYCCPKDGIIEQVLPWFQTFDMENHVEFCEQLLVDMIDSNKQWFYYDDHVVSESVKTLLDVLDLAISGGLAMIKRRAETVLGRLIKSDRMMRYYFVLDIEQVKRIVFRCLPIQKDMAGTYTSNSCPVLWRGLRSLIKGHLKSLSADEISECEMFSHLVYNAIRIESGRCCEFDSEWQSNLDTVIPSH